MPTTFLPPLRPACLTERDDFATHGLVVRRDDDGDVRANVAHVAYHSPGGFECGYAGSGPADLALAVMHALLPPISEAEEAAQRRAEAQPLPKDEPALSDALVAALSPARNVVRLPRTGARVSQLAWDLHQRFEGAFIAPMDTSGGHVPIETLRAWVRRHGEPWANL